MKILALNEIDPLPVLGAKVVKPAPPSDVPSGAVSLEIVAKAVAAGIAAMLRSQLKGNER